MFFHMFVYVLHVRSVLIRLGFCFYISCVRVTESREMGYGTITVRITDGQSAKIEIMDRHIELEANHRWVKYNYPIIITHTINIIHTLIHIEYKFLIKREIVTTHYYSLFTLRFGDTEIIK